MKKKITRFAPSPTGYLHIGNIRTALFSWLHSIKNNGIFILRIDDTDKERNSNHYTENIIENLNWLNIEPNIKPIYQSHRKFIYKEIIISLLNKNKAYKCFCTKERLLKLKEKQIILKKNIKYDKFCLYNNINKKNDNFVIRFKNPIKDSINFNDLIKGKINISNEEIDDFIIAKNNYEVTYNFATVIDDINMNITDIIRGEDHISNTAKQINLIMALNEKIPNFAHLPMVLNKNKKLMSKRNNENSINYYKNKGFLPKSILNYILRLGWSYKNKEIFTKKEMITLFNIKDVNKSSCIFDLNKLIWFNKHYIKQSSIEEIKKYILPIIKKYKINLKYIENLESVILFQKTRVSTLKEMILKSICFYKEKNIFNKKINNSLNNNIINCIKSLYKEFENKSYIWDMINIKNTIKIIINKYNVKLPELANNLRIIITGKNNPYPLFELMFILGVKLILNKLQIFIKYINNSYTNNN